MTVLEPGGKLNPHAAFAARTLSDPGGTNMATVADLDIIGKLNQLDELSQAEYGMSAVEVAEDPDRLRRLTGIMIKQPFGKAHPIGNHRTATGARRYWEWDTNLLVTPDEPGSPEYRMLDELRAQAGFTPTPDGFIEFTRQTETERGLFKIAALWLHDKLRGHNPKSLRRYYGAEESKKAAALLDLADMLANFALTPVYMALLPAGGFIVPILLLAAKHGYASVFDSKGTPDGEN
jgi:hypothetical protein